MVLLGVKVDEGTDRTLPEASLLLIQALKPFLPFLVSPEEKKMARTRRRYKVKAKERSISIIHLAPSPEGGAF